MGSDRADADAAAGTPHRARARSSSTCSFACFELEAPRACRARADRVRKERAGPGAGRAARRRDPELRFHGRLSRLRHRHRQSAGRRAAGHSAPSDRHRRPDRGVHRGAVRARRRSRHSRRSWPRARADSGRRDRLLLPGADARPVSGPRRRRGAARQARSDRRPEGARSVSIVCCDASIPTPRTASCRATGSAWCARSRSTSRPAGR